MGADCHDDHRHTHHQRPQVTRHHGIRKDRARLNTTIAEGDVKRVSQVTDLSVAQLSGVTASPADAKSAPKSRKPAAA
jgi:hypothetical protein